MSKRVNNKKGNKTRRRDQTQKRKVRGNRCKNPGSNWSKGY